MPETNPLVWYDSMTEEFATAQFGFPYVWHELQKHVDNDGCEWGSCKPGNRWEWERLTRPASDGWADPGADPAADWNKPKTDNPINPKHYQGFSNGDEVIDIAENLNFNRGNSVKYTARAGAKDPAKEIEDLKKSRWYLDREIARLEREAL